ncbi:MAG: hypothetical protein CR972_03985 [Candidatus Moraniibacteriota bacterium]|nr:MAG: hypothetical protein CR972_03985 [Candidatus Moranbacteria bacterium]
MKKIFSKRKIIFLFVFWVTIFGWSFFSIWRYSQNKIYNKKDVIESVNISIITDIDHCPSRSSVSEENLSQFISFTKEHDFDFVISLGDNASHGLAKCSETGDQDVRYIADKIRSIGKPTYFVLGDHDIQSEVYSFEAWLEMIQKEKTFYSFDVKDVHVVVLDTVLGGEPMSDRCTEKEECIKQIQRIKDAKKKPFLEYKKLYPHTEKTLERERLKQEKILKDMRREIKLTRHPKVRDAGRISQVQIDWLKKDIKKTKRDKILVFSDHPLFPFASDRKSYNVVDADIVRDILKKSKKNVVCISGEAHLWHDEIIDGIQYYIIDEFKKANGSWAVFSWDENGYYLEKITHSKEDKKVNQ